MVSWNIARVWPTYWSLWKLGLKLWTKVMALIWFIWITENTFDTVPHARLIDKLKSLGISGKLLDWIAIFLYSRKIRVRVRISFSEWVEVLSGVPQGSVLGPLLFLVFVNYLPDRISSVINTAGRLKSIHPFILYQTTKVHRLGIHIKRYKHTAYTQTDKDRHTPNNTDYYNELNNKTHRTIALSQADALLAKLMS